MPLVAYGHSRLPLLMLADRGRPYSRYERFLWLTRSGRSSIVADPRLLVNSVNRYSLLNDQMPPHLTAELLTQYDTILLMKCCR